MTAHEVEGMDLCPVCWSETFDDFRRTYGEAVRCTHCRTFLHPRGALKTSEMRKLSRPTCPKCGSHYMEAKRYRQPELTCQDCNKEFCNPD